MSLPSAPFSQVERKLSIILPVYSGEDLIAALFDSLKHTVLSSTSDYFEELIVINDNPANGELGLLLERSLADLPLNWQLLKNEENLGFVCSVNRGFREAGSDNDILVANSDIVFFQHWLDNLSRSVALVEKRQIKWASLTPFSNSATIATIPIMGQEYDEFLGQNSPQAIASLCHRLFSNEKDLPEVPVGVGFCMLLNRRTIDEIGHFDTRYSPGYGEETDWCLRASQKGYKHFFAPSVFIYHAGGQSFSERKKELLERGGRLINQQHPGYDELIAEYIGNPVNHVCHQKTAPFIAALELLKYKEVSLHLSNVNVFGAVGGLEKYVEEVCVYLLREKNTSSVLIYPMTEEENEGRYAVYIDQRYFSSFSVHALKWFLQLLSELELISIESVNLHHTMNWRMGDLHKLAAFFKKAVKKRTVIVHDYFQICRQHNLLWNDEKFCAAPLQAKNSLCSSCEYGDSVTSHREAHSALLASFNRIVFASITAKEIFLKIFPDCASSAVVYPHYQLSEECASAAVSDSVAHTKQRLSIVFHGATGLNKGIDRFAALIEQFREKFDWVTIGIEDYFRDNPLVTHIHYHGKEDKNIESILSRQTPAFVFLGSRVPETFSYTLHEALAAGLPILTTEESGNVAAMVETLKAGYVFPGFVALRAYLAKKEKELLADAQSFGRRYKVALNTDAIGQIYTVSR